MARRERALPYFVGRFGYWHLQISGPLLSPPGGPGQATSLAQEGQEETRTNARAILWGHDRPQHSEYRLDLHLELEAMQISSEADERMRALHYWIVRDRLWYTDGEAGRLLRALPGRQQQALDALNKRYWAPKKELWKWDTLLPRIARDQRIFQQIVELGPTRAGVVDTTDPASRTLAQHLFNESRHTARKIYVEYSRQASVLLGLGAKPRRDCAIWLRDAGVLNRQGRMQLAPIVANVEEAFHWFAHALRNLARYRNADPPLPWPDTSSSCQRSCLRALARLAA